MVGLGMIGSQSPHSTRCGWRSLDCLPKRPPRRYSRLRLMGVPSQIPSLARSAFVTSNSNVFCWSVLVFAENKGLPAEIVPLSKRVDAADAMPDRAMVLSFLAL